jgi:hypothetical protein
VLFEWIRVYYQHDLFIKQEIKRMIGINKDESSNQKSPPAGSKFKKASNSSLSLYLIVTLARIRSFIEVFSWRRYEC